MARPAPGRRAAPPRSAPVSKASPGGLDGAIDEYLMHLKVERGLRPNSLTAYAQDLRELAAFLVARLGDPAPLARVDPPLLLAYLQAIAPKLKARSQARRVVALRGLFRWLREEGQIAVDPSQGLAAPRLAQKLPDLLGRDEVLRLLAAPGSDGPLALRDTALLELLYASGCRISEALDLSLDRLYLDQAVVRLIGKGDKMRLCPIGGPAVAALHAWLRDGRPALARGQAPEPAGLPQQERRPPVTPGLLPEAARARDRGRHHPRHLAAQAPPQLRHPPARGRRRPSRRADPARPRRHRHDPDLHPRQRRPAAQRPPQAPPARLSCAA